MASTVTPEMRGAGKAVTAPSYIAEAADTARSVLKFKRQKRREQRSGQ